MTLSKKIALFGSLTSLLVSGFVVATQSNGTGFFAQAASGCKHSGNHYSAILPTNKSSGVKEYWVCCNCHEHYFTKPSTGDWTYVGTAPLITDSKDDRYIAKLKYSTSTYTDAQGITYKADGKTIKSYSITNNITDITIPEGVTDIGTAFAGKAITSISIPSTVETIEGGAFQNCSKLKNVTINEGVDKLESTGSWPSMHGAFQYCSALEYIVIPSTVTEMDGYEFASANDNLVIYCVAASKPKNWSSAWNQKHQIGSSSFTVYWGLGTGWHYDKNNVPQPGK